MVTFGQMGQTSEGESHFINMGHTYQNCGTWKQESHWAKWVTFGQMGQNSEGESHLSKLWHLEVGVTLGKMGHIWPNGSNLGG